MSTCGAIWTQEVLDSDLREVQLFLLLHSVRTLALFFLFIGFLLSLLYWMSLE